MTENNISGVEISSPTRIIFPKEKITKLDVAKYYANIAPYILPHISQRLVSVIRCHENINSGFFFKKHPTAEGEDIVTKKVGEDEYFSIANKKGLIKQIQLGTIEFHVWGSTIFDINHPNLMVFDLDPDKNLGLDVLRQGTLILKNTLDELGLKSYLKTSGGKGYHVVVPFEKHFSWQKFSHFSKQIALLLEQKHHDLFTSNVRKQNRTGKIYVDYGRNTKGATCVAPFSLRARAGAPVSMPIEWSDLNKFAPNDFNLKNAPDFVRTHRPWRDFPKFTTKLEK